MKVCKIGFKMAFATFFLILATGCASNKYACKGYPQGVACADPVTVYQLTEERDQVSSENLNKKSPEEDGRRKEVVEGILRPPVDMTKPVLQPAQVLRIWIAPWVDEYQDLHGASHVFTEITPRRWSFGAQGVAIPRVTYPYQAGSRKNRDEGDVPSVKTQASGQVPQPQVSLPSSVVKQFGSSDLEENVR